MEPTIPQLARLSEAHRTAAEAAGLATAQIDPTLLGDMAVPVGLDQDTNTFLVTLDAKLAPEAFPALANRACGERPYCKFMAWSAKASTPAALPVTPVQQRAMSFSYLRDRAFGFEKALWNCTEYKRSLANECMKAQVSMSMGPPVAPATTPDGAPAGTTRTLAAPEPGMAAVKSVPGPLTGVRRKTETNAPATPDGPASTTGSATRAAAPKTEAPAVKAP